MRHLGAVACAVACACGPVVDLGPSPGDGTLATTSTAGADAGSTTGRPVTTGSSGVDVTGPASTTTDLDTTHGSSTTMDPTCDGLDEGPGGLDVGPLHQCDLFAQDCEPGMKCVPRGWLFDLTCVPIDPAPLPDGSPCPVDEPDSCGPLSWCTPAGPSGEGTCVPLCLGSYSDPTCPEGTLCVVDDENVLAYCAPPCDPFETGACPFGICLPTRHGFGCVPGGIHTAGEPCWQHDSCVAQHACRDAELVPGCCDPHHCCAPLCSDDHPCERGSCIPLVDEIPGPPGIGTCG